MFCQCYRSESKDFCALQELHKAAELQANNVIPDGFCAVSAALIK